LLKLLAADKPLSIQAHPSPEQAQAGFARENADGIAGDDPSRNYKDSSHKPELIVALSDAFEALCGFREVSETIAQLETLTQANIQACQPTSALSHFISELNTRDDALSWALHWALTSDDAHALVSEISVAGKVTRDDLLIELARDYPGDPGIIVALLLNRVTLSRGQGLYLPAGNMHAYIRGFGVELMAASDNVLRGGLTTKHVDVPELLSVVTTSVMPVPYLVPEVQQDGVELFLPDVPDFALAHLGGTDLDAHLSLTRHSIAICTSGQVTLRGKQSEIRLQQGEIACVTADEGLVNVSGTGELFAAI
jgi:mannose-6-phosphate isomerase